MVDRAHLAGFLVVGAVVTWVLFGLAGEDQGNIGRTEAEQEEPARTDPGHAISSTSDRYEVEVGQLDTTDRVRWWEDKQSVERFLAEYQRELPRAFEDQMGHRSAPAEVRERLASNLEKTIQAAEDNLLFNTFSAGEFDGLAFDSLRSGTSWLAEQTRRYSEWKAGMERGDGFLPSIDHMRQEVRYFPPEMILSGMLERDATTLEWSNEQVARVSAARNSLLRELALIEAHIWEVAPAATRAAEALGFETGFEVDFAELIPEWKDFHSMMDAEVGRYLLELELIAGQFPR